MIGSIYFIFFVSGMSGLIYQVIWVREFGQIFGNTIQSASLVSGTFVLGLGVGSWLAGKIIDGRNEINSKAGLACYAYAELLIGLMGLLIAIATPRLEALSPWISSYTQGEHGWYGLTAMSYLLRYLVAAVFVGPITIVMGATLTFLIRFVLSRSVEQAGWKIGLLYGMNTLGAALGCALVDLWAVPTIGLMRTKMIAVACNVVAGMCALYLLKTVRIAENATRPGPGKVERARDKQTGRGVDASGNDARSEGRGMDVPAVETEPSLAGRAGLAIAISGFCAMGMEIVWFRFMSSVYSLSQYVFSLLLVTILTGMWAGSFLGGYLSKKFRNPENLYVCSQLLFSISLLSCLFLFFESDRKLLIALFRDTFYGREAVSQGSLLFKAFDYSVILYPALMTMFVPALFMGFAFPMINDILQKNTASVGSNAGRIYLCNAVGAIAGSLTTGFVLLPKIGMQNSITVLAFGAALASVPILLVRRPAIEESVVAPPSGSYGRKRTANP